MKLILESWRQYLNEADESNLGAFVKLEKGYTISLILVNLTKIKSQLETSKTIDDFLNKLKDRHLFKDATIGYIEAMYNPMLSKAHPGMGGSGGACYNTYSIRKSIGRGYGEQLYNALLGWCAINNIYTTADRHSVSQGAESRWKKIDQQTNDEVPPKEAPYTGKFDDFNNTTTEPRDDDCLVHGISSLDKGYKDVKQVDYFKQLEYNMSTFFENEIEPLFDEPGFFGKLFGSTPVNKAEKIKKKLLAMGRQKFIDFEFQALKNPELR